MSDVAPMRDVVIVGGACYGTFYAGQLARARERGKAEFRRVIVVDRDPDLMFEWVVRRARARWPGRDIEIAPVPGALGTPYDRPAADHTRYVSFADWVCPTHCVEPELCPAIGSRRTWEMPEAIEGLAQRLRFLGRPLFGPALFVCRHHVFGVGTFAVDAVLAGDRTVAEAGAAGEPAEVLVGTISRCHGAVNLLSIGRLMADGR